MEPMHDGPNHSSSVDWSAAIWAGVIGGVVFMMMEMMLMPMFGFAPGMWAPPRMIAAVALGKDVLPPPATFDLTVVMVAMMIHFATSIMLAIAIAYISRGKSMATAMMVGVVASMAIYGFVFYIMSSVAWPWFAMARNWVSVVTHIVFGMIAGAWYHARARA